MKETVLVTLEQGACAPEYISEESSNFYLCINSFKKVYKGKKEMDAGLLNQGSPGVFTLRPFERLLVGTGVSIALPAGIELQVRSSTSIAINTGITVMSSPSLVDSTHTGEICILLFNSCQFLSRIKIGDKIAKGIFIHYQKVDFQTQFATQGALGSGQRLLNS